MTSSAGLRLPAGFSRTRMSPLVCWVAKRPSSDPVRRVNAAISGVFLSTPSIFRTTPIDLRKRAARRSVVVDDEAPFVGGRAGTRCRAA